MDESKILSVDVLAFERTLTWRPIEYSDDNDDVIEYELKPAHSDTFTISGEARRQREDSSGGFSWYVKLSVERYRQKKEDIRVRFEISHNDNDRTLEDATVRVATVLRSHASDLSVALAQLVALREPGRG